MIDLPAPVNEALVRLEIAIRESAEREAKLKQALVKCAIPLEALNMDIANHNAVQWVCPELQESIREAVAAAREAVTL